MKTGNILAMISGNVFLFFTSLDGFLRVGTQLLAFCAAGLSLTILVYKERDTLTKIITVKGREKLPKG